MKLGRTVADVVEMVNSNTKTFITIKSRVPKYSYIADFDKHGIYVSIALKNGKAFWFHTDDGAVRVEVIGDNVKVDTFTMADIKYNHLYKFVTEYEKEDK